MMPGSKGLNPRELALYNVVTKIKTIQIAFVVAKACIVFIS